MRYSRFLIDRNGDNIVALPVWVAILMALAAPWLAIGGLIVALLCGCSFHADVAQPQRTRHPYYEYQGDYDAKDWRQ